MNFWQRIQAAWSVVFNRFEAAQVWRADRSMLPASVQDAQFDATCAARTEIMRKARYFEKNNAIAQRIGSVFADYTVGPNGLILLPNSSDPKWNAAAKLYWTTTQNFIDLNSRQNLGTLQGLIAWRWLFDGEIFIIKTRGQSRNGASFPRIQLIESHRVATPPDMRTQEGKTIIDGVDIDSDGRPIAYRIKDSSDSQIFRRVDAANVIHVFEPNRPGEYRGISFFHAAINYLHLLDDLQVLEFRAATTQAEAATFITNAAGQLDASRLRQNRVGIASPVSSTGENGAQQMVEYYRMLYGGRIFAGKSGDTFSHTTPTRPADATRALWSYLTSCVCAAVGIPKMICFSEWLENFQGTVARGDYDIAAQFFRARSAVMAAAMREVYIFCLGWGKNSDPTLRDPPADWTNVTVRPPRAVNVDAGRNSQAMLAELAQGATNYELIYSPLGLDWQEEITKLADQIAFINKLAADKGINPADLREQAVAPIAQPVPDPNAEDLTNA